MRMMVCQCCSTERPTNETFDVQGRTLCKDCGDQFFEEHPESDVSVAQNVDPTICANCGADNGDTPHGRIIEVPACAACTEFFRNRPYPKWVKMFFLAVAVLVVVSLVWNGRFFQGYFEMRAAFAAWADQDFSEAASQMSAAAEHVPESMELREFAAFLQGILCLQKDECEKAETYFTQCTHMPPEFGVPMLRQTAAIGTAFNRKDYDQFLQIAEQAALQRPSDPIAQAQVASALACLYAVGGDDDLRRQAESKLEEAKKLGTEGIEASRYEERIRHRLKTREIISSEEYEQRFPEVQPLSQ